MKTFSFSLLIVLLVACQSPKPDIVSVDFIIENVNILDVRSGEILENRHVLIKEGKVHKISKEKVDNQSETIIDGSGKYLMPGLTEMHAHIPSPDWGRDDANETLFLYLANGVTTIRGMLGHEAHLKLREQALNNEIISPRIFISSPSVNGNTVKTVDEARQKVTQYKEDGYDFLKLHPGLKREVFDEVVKTAKEVGIKYAGHVAIDVGVNHAIENGYATIDHVDGFIEGLVPSDAGVDPNANGFFGYNFTDLVDLDLIGPMVAKTVENKVWIVPTQSLFDRWFSPDDPNTLAMEPEMKYMPKSTLDQWVRSKQQLISDDSYSAEQWERFNGIRQKLIKELQLNGHGLLLGSDAPQVFNVPGFSIYHELNGMILAGVSPLEAIQSGTINPAKFFNMEGQFGVIIEGANAEFILLNANPLLDLETLKSPEGVMMGERMFTREILDEKLAEIASRVEDL